MVKGGIEVEMEKDQSDNSNPSHSNPSRSPPYSPTLSDTKIRSPASRSPGHVPSHDEQDRKEQRRSMSVDSRNSKNESRPSRSSRSGSREGAINSIEIKGLTKMVYATHLEQIFAAYGPIEEIFMPSDPYTQENLGRAFITYRSSSSAEKAEDCMDKGQIDGAIVSVRCEDIQVHELRSSYNSTPRSNSHRRDTNRTSNDHRYGNKDERQRYPDNSYDRDRRSEGQRRSRSASPY
ncbi:uncharacterized protein FA14DRAFT_159772 [Meira miltonrushii]|uniref:RRM domain-containing protein n=1 Tax=Meira miltonrushii TaxID=1280837 RepID=A0A316VKE3_9BASI|nr:uncharacterized protein FA14DRAFT_159772 [Meira miltonrushii]PWN37990.1 hypothetical protein FA14DRAFT_159772 [Meira miltonrushii]